MNKFSLVVLCVCATWFLGCGGDEFTSSNGKSDAGVADVKTDKPHDAKPESDVQADDVASEALPEGSSEAEASIPETGVDADAGAEADADAAVESETGMVEAGEEPDVEAPEAEAEGGPDADAEPPPDVIEEQPLLTDCQKLGVIGKVTIIVRHNVSTSVEAGVKVLAVMSKLTFNNASKNTNFATTCWALAGQNEFACLPLDKFSLPTDVESGMIVEFEPGETAPGVQLSDGDGFCNAQDCPTGDFLVCSGKEKEPICHVKNGVWDPPEAKATGPWNITTIKCTFP